jgi:hypothetical protein
MGEFDVDAGDEGGECGPCSRGSGLLLLGLGLALCWMGGDLLTGGAFTRLVFGAARIDAAPPADNETDGAGWAGEAGDTADDEPGGE